METQPQELSGKIRLSAEGDWFHEGVKITHERTIAYLFQNTCVEGGNCFLKGEKTPVPVEVEDAPFFVRELHDEQIPWQIKLSDGSLEPLEFSSLDSGKENVFYSSVKGGLAKARFSRPVYYHLTRHLVEKDGYLGLMSNGLFYPLRAKEVEPEKVVAKKPIVMAQSQAKREPTAKSVPAKVAKPVAKKAAPKKKIKAKPAKKAVKKKPAKKKLKAAAKKSTKKKVVKKKVKTKKSVKKSKKKR